MISPAKTGEISEKPNDIHKRVSTPPKEIAVYCLLSQMFAVFAFIYYAPKKV